jgi:hypothetical protein
MQDCAGKQNVCKNRKEQWRINQSINQGFKNECK